MLVSGDVLQIMKPLLELVLCVLSRLTLLATSLAAFSEILKLHARPPAAALAHFGDQWLGGEEHVWGAPEGARDAFSMKL